jgi:hypothetical protein
MQTITLFEVLAYEPCFHANRCQYKKIQSFTASNMDTVFHSFEVTVPCKETKVQHTLEVCHSLDLHNAYKRSNHMNHLPTWQPTRFPKIQLCSHKRYAEIASSTNSYHRMYGSAWSLHWMAKLREGQPIQGQKIKERIVEWPRCLLDCMQSLADI